MQIIWLARISFFFVLACITNGSILQAWYETYICIFLVSTLDLVQCLRGMRYIYQVYLYITFWTYRNFFFFFFCSGVILKPKILPPRYQGKKKKQLR